jgi:hypothetical protein
MLLEQVNSSVLPAASGEVRCSEMHANLFRLLIRSESQCKSVKRLSQLLSSIGLKGVIVGVEWKYEAVTIPFEWDFVGV